MTQQFADSGVLHCSTVNKLAAVCEERLIKDHLGYLHSAVNVIVQNETNSGWCSLVGGAETECMHCYRSQQPV